ncbi:hypothetical protein EYZ11_001473 [Aspergillus tanneri]|uniref:Flavin reductase like domain-containing protein n=1 Tax=Aspergillus tanneri TaxID=1220188 RepID=A0A4S3JUM0_9EURO|nr:uncharacterized protein ATNIH1004_008765 [Aspergillus tanneri]KAA8644560.1 hypothetical protein ATNIH1004_008765 [Aspergillus tanneri]THC99077.1 hypothetical protein EYZ11_001473 [Aspergillus tanneri]
MTLPMRVASRIGGKSGVRCPSRFPRIQCSSLRTITDVTGLRAAITTGETGPETHCKPEPTDQTPSHTLSDQVRLLMRRVPYPVAIITATDPHEADLQKAFRGMTVSSFNTVTLCPQPVISFNVRQPSETLTALQSSRRFLVHLLAAEKEPACLARDFSRGNHNLSIMNGKGDFEFVAHSPIASSSTSTSTPATPNARPLPLLRKKTETDIEKGHSSFPFVFECFLHPHNVTVSDHTIVVGTVVRVLSTCSSDPDPQTGTSTDLCLTYANTRFWKMGQGII